MYETKTSDLLLSEAIDIVGRHVCADNWQGKNSLKIRIFVIRLIKSLLK